MSKLSKIILLLAIAALASCTRVYEPGDYYKGDGFEGIVVTVDANNSPMLLLSFEEAHSLAADSAEYWAEQIGEGWRLPQKGELAQIYRVKTLINRTLEKKKKKLILNDFTYYWSSTPCSETHCYACGPDGVGCYYKENDGSSYRARAVRLITE